MTSMTAEEFRTLMARRLGRRSKYRAVPTEYRGVVYDSKAEALRARALDEAKTAGLIWDWIRQVRFTLGCPENTYRADFVVIHDDRTIHAEDVKGVETAAFKRIRTLWAAYGPCDLRVVRRISGGWETEVIGGR